MAGVDLSLCLPAPELPLRLFHHRPPQPSGDSPVISEAVQIRDTVRTLLSERVERFALLTQLICALTAFHHHRLQRVQSPLAGGALFGYSFLKLQQDRNRNLFTSLFRHHYWHIAGGDPPVESGMADPEQPCRGASRHGPSELRFEVFSNRGNLRAGTASLDPLQPSDVLQSPLTVALVHACSLAKLSFIRCFLKL